MKQLIAIIVGVVLVVSMIVVGFTLRQINQEELALTSDLQYRTRVLADSLKETIEPAYASSSTKLVQKTVDKFVDRQRLEGLAVYDNKGNLIVATSGFSHLAVDDAVVIPDAMDSDKPMGEFSKISDSTLYVFATPLHMQDQVIGALIVVQKADYIAAKINEIWKTNLLRLLLQALLFSIAIAIVVRWILFRPLVRFVESVKQTRIGQTSKSAGKPDSFFRPLASEIAKMSSSLVQARSVASEEARMRLEKLDTPWTAERLKEFIKAYLKDRKIIVVSNREPYVHEKTKNGIAYHVPAGGVVTAIEPVMEACGGTWIAHGSGDADKSTADEDGKISVPPDDPKYTLRRVWLTDEEVLGYYNGFSNEALWPLCHMVHVRPIFRQEDWTEYRKVNAKFADNVLAEIRGVSNPIVLVQDLHLSLLPQLIKKRRPDAKIGLFWHIPWPNSEAFSICPFRKEILQGMLGADVIGFHTQQFCNNFMDTVSKEVESIADFEHFSITRDRHTAYIKPFPISIPFTNGELSRQSVGRNMLESIGVKTKYIGLGAERMDYIKGILERFKGVEFFLDSNSKFREQFSFVQIASPSRSGVEKYRQFAESVKREAERINQKFKANSWQPIILLNRHYAREDLQRFYREVDFCMVTSLQDGMNLVAKEFVAARSDETGALILSQFTGAARGLKGALIVNPYNAEQTAQAIHEALTMPPAEQKSRMKKMRESVKNYNVYRWSAELIKAVASLS